LKLIGSDKDSSVFMRKDIIVIVSSFAFILALLLFTFFSPNYYDETKPVIIDVPKGATLTQIIDSLYEKKVIPNKVNIKIAAFIYGADKKIKAGRYFIPNGLNYFKLIDLLTGRMPIDQISVTIPEGIWQFDLAGILKEKLGIDSIRVIELSRSKSFIYSLGLNTNNLEGYLLPETYYFYPHSTAEEILRKLKNEMDKIFTPQIEKRMKELKMTRHQILTLASIIEAESNIFSEYKIISGVYHNRLKRGMALQADPTVQYLIRERKKKKVYWKDLNINSRYNTYKHPGLPPGPINNPGKDAIMAALYPDKNNYLYFVADGTGGHSYSKSYTEHSENVTRYREWRKNQNLSVH
jgi:UPF0755 protein